MSEWPYKQTGFDTREVNTPRKPEQWDHIQSGEQDVAFYFELVPQLRAGHEVHGRVVFERTDYFIQSKMEVFPYVFPYMVSSSMCLSTDVH